jgi:hypothetical protein
MKNIFIICLFLFSFHLADGQEYKYWVGFKDKKNTSYTIENPSQYLSQRAIDRRKKQHIAVDSTDLPVNDAYISKVEALGAKTLGISRWINGIIISVPDTLIAKKITDLSFVSEVELTWEGAFCKIDKNKKWLGIKAKSKNNLSTSYYGSAANQIEMLHGEKLQEAGFRGKDVHIAVIADGFLNANKISSLKNLYDNNQLIGTKDFGSPHKDIYAAESHGTMMLSTMASNVPNVMVGTAPDASYWLIRTQDTEYPVEYDYFICALEFAESVGADIATTSLAYSLFNNNSMNSTYDYVAGKMLRAKKAAILATRKGMILINGTEAESHKNLAYISMPSQTDSLPTGALTFDLTTNVSNIHSDSTGLVDSTAILEINSINVISPKNTIEKVEATSFSPSILAGMVACLWQAFPNMNNMQIIDLIKKSATKTENPNNALGIPNFYAAYQKGLGLPIKN